MKQALIIFLLSLSSSAYAIDSLNSSKLYVNISTGFDNPTGILGLSAEVPIFNGASIVGGCGLSSWGGKFAGEFRGYVHARRVAWAFGTGATYSTGLGGTTKPVVNIFLSGYCFAELGKTSRLYVQMGYAHRTTTDFYEADTGHQLSGLSNAIKEVRAPGGYIAAVGLSFSLIKRR